MTLLVFETCGSRVGGVVLSLIMSCDRVLT